MKNTKFRHRKVVRNMHKKAKRIGMMKVFGGYPVARSETEYFRCGIPGQRTPTETYEKIRYGIDYNKIQNNDEPPF